MIELLENLDTLAVQRAKINGAIEALNSINTLKQYKIQRVASVADLPTTGLDNVIYHVLDTNILKVWNGASYTTKIYVSDFRFVYFASEVDMQNNLTPFEGYAQNFLVLKDSSNGDATQSYLFDGFTTTLLEPLLL